ncbi:globin domain-containing protein [Streptomyces sp. NPDC048506]|uniref:globin domain-containing protein n=1 Tax=Streptomyces sp. NPDC048506 TaxID=3155028 RepID=UPI003412D8D6
MDAPTTTSADGGSSGGSSGDWGWFTPPAKKSSEEQQERHDVQGRQDPDGRTESSDRSARNEHSERRGTGEPNDQYGRREAYEQGERGERVEWPGRERIPSRPVNPIRPVGTAAEREREAEPQVPQPHRETDRRPTASAEQPAAPSGYADPFSPYVPPSREPEPVHESAHPLGAPTGASPTAPNVAPAPNMGPAPAPNAFQPQHQAQAQPQPRAQAQPQTQAQPQAQTPPQAPTAAAPAPAPASSVFAPKPPPAAPAPEPSLEAVKASAASAAPASPDAILIRRTMADIEPVADKVTSYFYALLFVQHPDLRALFPASMDTQRDRLFKALLTAAQHVDDADILTAYLANLGRGHRKYGTLPDHYPAVGECLLNALARYATSSWEPETEAAWVRAYTAISQIMIDAAAENEAVAPAWWQAEVVSHELRTPDIAVVTVRPDQPYPFLAGQYTSIETPWWPRVWRHYSFAAAPRSDGLLSFHVKAVPAGWVSNAMVHRARPGDVIRLGAPAGSMTVDHSTRNGLLCVGGGTGIAPIKALVEDVAEHGVRRPVDVFYGARSGHDLYDLDTMLRLEQSHPWLSVRPVVATGPTARGTTTLETGQLPDAVRQHGPFREYDAYLSGPPGLIRSGVDALVGVGIPTDRIRHDSIEELVAAGD